MKKPMFTRVAVFGSVAALGIAGCGGQAATNASSSSSGRPPAGRAAPDLSGLAKTLGVSEAKLRAAMEATRPAPGSRPTSDRSAALAEKLGLSASKVRAAMKGFMPRGGPPPSSSSSAQS
jgi:hypothetical protein